MQPLHIDPLIPEIIDALRRRRTLVLAAPPGAGKTTRVPPAVLAAGLLAREHPSLVMLQPRRPAARAAARRIAEEQRWSIGREVGWHIRFENRTCAATRLHVLTEGILTRRLQSDPYLEGVGAVVLDEFHERSLHTDLALARLKELRQTVRDDLIVIVMSATLDAGPVAKYLGDCPVIESPGRPFPVEIRYAPHDDPSPIPLQAAAAVRAALADAECEGHLLVFLPGLGEIRRAADELSAPAQRHGADLLPLHSRLSTAEQDRALAPSNRRKIILATNIAETSLTIEGVRVVIDSGYARLLRHDPQRGLDRLELTRVSRSSAVQRAGRAGRTAPGVCLRLWTRDEDRGLPEFEEPEVRRVDLAATVLALHEWGCIDPAKFDWFQRPPEEMLAGAERLLAMLGALDPAGRLTEIGRRLLDLPIHPRLGRMLLEAARIGRAHEAAGLAAILSERDMFSVVVPTRDQRRRGPGAPTTAGASDLLVRLDVLTGFDRGSRAPAGVDPAALRAIAAVRDDLIEQVPTSRSANGLGRWGGPPGPPESNSTAALSSAPAATDADDDLLRLTLLAHPDRVCRRRGESERGVMVGGRGVVLDPACVVRSAELFVAIDPQDTRVSERVEARVRIASAIRREWFAELFPQSVRREVVAEFDDARQAVAGLARTYYRDLVIAEDRGVAVDPERAGALLAEHVRPRAVALFEADEGAASLLRRVAFLHKCMPGVSQGSMTLGSMTLPEFTAAELAEIAADACAGRKSVAELRALGLAGLLSARMTHAARRALDEHAPEAVAVPTGNRIRLAYEHDRPPVLAVRLQELFGMRATPRVAGGKVAVVLHLLGPNFRPVQITDDLASFWANTYERVRKDLRARYPKHSWPEDPLTAPPVAKGGRRR